MTVAVAHQVSPTTAIALREAVREACNRDTDLAVLHVVESVDADRTEAYRAGVADDMERALGKELTLEWKLHLVTSATPSIGGKLVALADQVGAELLVIGARRRSPVGKALMGSVTQTVILDANVPVLVVKAPRS
jgi:nucleotide-binding universal stress UspA family protein